MNFRVSHITNVAQTKDTPNIKPNEIAVKSNRFVHIFQKDPFHATIGKKDINNTPNVAAFHATIGKKDIINTPNVADNNKPIKDLNKTHAPFLGNNIPKKENNRYTQKNIENENNRYMQKNIENENNRYTQKNIEKEKKERNIDSLPKHRILQENNGPKQDNNRRRQENIQENNRRQENDRAKQENNHPKQDNNHPKQDNNLFKRDSYRGPRQDNNHFKRDNYHGPRENTFPKNIDKGPKQDYYRIRQDDNRRQDNNRPRQDNNLPRQENDRPKQENNHPKQDNNGRQDSNRPIQDNNRPRQDNNRRRQDHNRPRQDNDRPRQDNNRPRQNNNAPIQNNPLIRQDKDLFKNKQGPYRTIHKIKDNIYEKDENKIDTKNDYQHNLHISKNATAAVEFNFNKGTAKPTDNWTGTKTDNITDVKPNNSADNTSDILAGNQKDRNSIKSKSITDSLTGSQNDITKSTTIKADSLTDIKTNTINEPVTTDIKNSTTQSLIKNYNTAGFAKSTTSNHEHMPATNKNTKKALGNNPMAKESPKKTSKPDLNKSKRKYNDKQEYKNKEGFKDKKGYKNKEGFQAKQSVKEKKRHLNYHNHANNKNTKTPGEKKTSSGKKDSHSGKEDGKSDRQVKTKKKKEIKGYQISKQVYKERYKGVLKKNIKLIKRGIQHLPLTVFHFIFNKKRNIFIRTTPKIFLLIKTLLIIFRPIRRASEKKIVFYITVVKKLFEKLLKIININFLLIKMKYFRPKMSLIRVINLFGLKENTFRHMQVFLFRKIYRVRYFFLSLVHKIICFSLTALEKTNLFTVSFHGLHSRNLNADTISHYISLKLAQYFKIQQILRDLLYDLKRAPMLRGLKIMVVGRISRKERAALILKKIKNISLNQFFTRLQYSTVFNIMKFGLVGTKVWVHLTDASNPYGYVFRFFEPIKLFNSITCLFKFIYLFFIINIFFISFLFFTFHSFISLLSVTFRIYFSIMHYKRYYFFKSVTSLLAVIYVIPNDFDESLKRVLAPLFRILNRFSSTRTYERLEALENLPINEKVSACVSIQRRISASLDGYQQVLDRLFDIQTILTAQPENPYTIYVINQIQTFIETISMDHSIFQDMQNHVYAVYNQIRSQIQAEVINAVQPEVQQEVINEVQPEVQQEVINEVQPEVINEVQPEVINEVQPEVINAIDLQTIDIGNVNEQIIPNAKMFSTPLLNWLNPFTRHMQQPKLYRIEHNGSLSDSFEAMKSIKLCRIDPSCHLHDFSVYYDPETMHIVVEGISKMIT